MNVTQPITRMARAEPPPTRLNRAKPITHLTRVPTLISPFLSPPSPLYSRRTVAGKSKSFSTPQFTLYYLLHSSLNISDSFSGRFAVKDPPFLQIWSFSTITMCWKWGLVLKYGKLWSLCLCVWWSWKWSGKCLLLSDSTRYIHFIYQFCVHVCIYRFLWTHICFIAVIYIEPVSIYFFAFKLI